MNCLSKGLIQGSSTALWLQLVALASLLGTAEPGDEQSLVMNGAEEEASHEGFKWHADVREMSPALLHREQLFESQDLSGRGGT